MKTLAELYDLTPAQIWAAWKNQELTAGDFAWWQDRHNYYFSETGRRILARRLFHRLERGYYTGEYIVLNDGRRYATIWADSDESAVKLFQAGAYGSEALA
jgi:hypothetical protein